MGERNVEPIGQTTLKRMREMPRVFAPVMRCYVRVVLGAIELLHIDFNADTLMETRAAERVAAKLRKHPEARAIVSKRCNGALAWCPVLGEPFTAVDDTYDDDRASISESGLWVLQRLRVAALVLEGKRAQAATRLVQQGYARRHGDLVCITASGLAALDELDKEAGK